MSKIFLSHSSVNNASALAVANWLADSGWDDYFLDLEPARGLAPGERWQEALKAAADRCEAVLFLISPAWRDSRWCLAEFLLAKQLGKTIFGVLIEATPLESLPKEITAEWQLCDLVNGAERQSLRVVPAANHSLRHCVATFRAMRALQVLDLPKALTPGSDYESRPPPPGTA